MSLDVSGQVRKLHGPMTDSFRRVKVVRHALGTWHWALGCHFHVDILFFFAPSLVLRCGIGSEISTLNFETTLHTVFGSCFRNQWACSLPVGLFSHCWMDSCRSKVCNAMASGRNMCRPAPPVCWEKGNAGVFARWRWLQYPSVSRYVLQMFEETWESFLGLRASASQEMPRPFLYDMTKVDLVDTEASAYLYPSASTATCVQSC